MTEQTKDILSIIDGYLAQVGTDKSKLLSANIWISDIANFNEMNAVWDGWVVARQHAGPRDRRGEARRAAIHRRDHGDGGEVKPPRSPAARGRFSRVLAIAAALSLAPGAGLAADLDGRDARPRLGVPFAGILLSIALLPLLREPFLASPLRQGRRLLGRAASCRCARLRLGTRRARGARTPLLLDYIPFILLLFALFTVAGGIHVARQPRTARRGTNGDPAADRHRAGELHRHDRRLDGADPPAAPRQRRPPRTTSTSSCSSSSSSRISAAR